MEQIYLIEDINGLKYVGRSKKKLKYRLSEHKSDKKRNRCCTSQKLDLDNCEITCIDITDSSQEAHELEKFYINSIDCVNLLKYNFDPKEYDDKRKEQKKEYNKKNKDKKKEYDKKRHEKNKDEINRKRREKNKLMNTSE